MRKILVILLFLVVLMNSIYGATGDPTLVNKLNTALGKIKKWLVKLALPASAVAVLVGVFIRKLSFGDEQKLAIGKKVITNGLFGYAAVLSIDMILKAIENLVK